MCLVVWFHLILLPSRYTHTTKTIVMTVLWNYNVIWKPNKKFNTKLKNKEVLWDVGGGRMGVCNYNYYYFFSVFFFLRAPMLSITRSHRKQRLSRLSEIARSHINVAVLALRLWNWKQVPYLWHRVIFCVIIIPDCVVHIAAGKTGLNLMNSPFWRTKKRCLRDNRLLATWNKHSRTVVSIHINANKAVNQLTSLE